MYKQEIINIAIKYIKNKEFKYDLKLLTSVKGLTPELHIVLPNNFKAYFIGGNKLTIRTNNNFIVNTQKGITQYLRDVFLNEIEKIKKDLK